MNQNKAISKTVIVLALGALLFYAIGVWWGMPYATSAERIKAWGIDDESPLGPLTEIHNILQPKPNQWLSYPLMYSFVAALADAPYMLYLLITGGLTKISAVYPFGLADPIGALRVLTILAHLVSALMGALVVAAAYDVGQVLAERRTGIFYALLVLFSFPLVYYARNGNVDATALAFAALAMAAFCRIAGLGFTPQRGLWLGAFVGFALASKESNIGLFLLMPLLLLYWRWRPAANIIPPTTAFWRASSYSALTAFGAFGLGSGLFVDPHRYFAHVRYLQSLLALVADSATSAAYTFPYTWAGHLGYLQATLQNLLAALSLPGLILVVVSAGYALSKRTAASLPIGLALAYLLYLFATYRLVQIRYLMPVICLGLFYVAYGTVAAWQAKSRLIQFMGAALGVLTLSISLLHAVDLTYQMLFDSRYAAATWLATQTKAGDSIDYFGAASVLPALKAEVNAQLATEFHGMYVKPKLDDGKVQEILAGWRSRNPTYILIMPDHTNRQPLPYSHTVPPQLYADLLAGKAGYHLVAYFQTPALFPWLPLPLLDYPVVNPPIRIFAPSELAQAK